MEHKHNVGNDVKTKFKYNSKKSFINEALVG